MELKGKKVVIMGLGLHGGGVSSALFFIRAGAKVLVTDLKTKKELKPSLDKLKKYKSIEYVLGKHRKTDFKKADLIIRNPDVLNNSPYLKIARVNKISVHSDISFFLTLINKLPERKRPIIIGITGTKGKSTTAHLLHHVLTKNGKAALLAGNIKKSPLDYVTARGHIKKAQYIILELSSWQLESLDEHKLAPNIALITNILKDHLNRYPNFAVYRKSKALIYKHQKKNDSLVVPDAHKIQIDTLIHPQTLSAVYALAKKCKLTKPKIEKAIQTYKGLTGRLEKIAIKNGVTFYNDTCATQPDATEYGISNLAKVTRRGESRISKKSKLILIAGGMDKKLEYEDLAQTIQKHVDILILFKGSASLKILKALGKYPVKHKKIASMKRAVALGYKNAHKGDIILLSPASASFNMFQNEFDRGDQFTRECQKITKKTA